LEEGEAVDLTGKSGSGKSTLMKCIYRTYLPTSGHIYYRSNNHGRIDLASASEQMILRLRREDITYCSQFLQVIPRIPALEVVAASLIAKGCSAEKARALTQEYFERLNLPEELWDAYPATFSGGEQQRINIAQAIIARPRLLLVDEPTASLDRLTKDAVIKMI
jgi:alpha-D-ribose 1-methylphosphonate 5-triphosphate synthase subunit PhnL